MPKKNSANVNKQKTFLSCKSSKPEGGALPTWMEICAATSWRWWWQATSHLVTPCGLNSAASIPANDGVMVWFYSHTLTTPLFTLELLFPPKKPSRDGPFSADRVASLIVFFVHGPVLKLAATATNQPLSSLLALFKAPQKEAGKWNKTLSTPAGFSGTKVLLFNHHRWNQRKTSHWMNKTMIKQCSWRAERASAGIPLSLSTFQELELLKEKKNLLLLLFLTSLHFLNADSFFLIFARWYTTYHVFNMHSGFKKKQIVGIWNAWNFIIEDLTLFIINRGHRDTGKHVLGRSIKQ